MTIASGMGAFRKEWIGLWLCLGLTSAALAQISSDKVHVDIPAQSLSGALTQFGRDTGTEIVFTPEAVHQKVSTAIKGDFARAKAISLLLGGTGLTYRVTAQGAIVINGAPGSKASGADSANQEEAGKQSSQDFRVAQVDQGAAGPPVGKDQNSEKKQKEEGLTEIVVTGSHISGGGDPASPVQVYTRQDIETSGVGTVEEFISRLPQNFNGGANPETFGGIAGGGNSNNVVNGTGFNLRGLGNDSTLVLLNGQRMAPGNINGNWADVSLVPLSAIERIEVLNDGASAVYGADAVGGVVNFILRRDFDGGETNARYSAGEGGEPHETQVGQALGRVWSTGSALLNYEYVSTSALFASDRPYTNTQPGPTNLLPNQEKNAVLLSANQGVTSNFDLFIDGTYGHRSSSGTYTTPFFALHGPATSDAYSATAGGRLVLADKYHLDLAAGYAASDAHVLNYFNQFLSENQNAKSTIKSVDIKLDGPLWDMPYGPILFAVGGQYRRERFNFHDEVAMAQFNPDRNIAAEFAELRIPLLGSGSPNSITLLELSLADRNEHYSDFGGTNNPKVGLVWRPAPGIKLRATYGTSFKAPLLNDLNPTPSQVVAYTEPDPLIHGNTNVLQVFGGNLHLRPEKARTWTAGLDWEPAVVPGVRARITYYNIHFTQRINDIQSAGFDVNNALALENVLGPRIIVRNPPLSLVQQLASLPVFQDLTGIPGGVNLATVGAIVDSRKFNVGTVNTNGIDFGVHYARAVSIGHIETGVDGTYIAKFEDQVASQSPFVVVINTPYNPIDLRLRADVILQRDALTVAGYLNYVNGYKDNRSPPTVPVASWTTVDISASYDLKSTSEWVNGLTLKLSVLNATNAAPPFVAASNVAFPGIQFDGANANVLGRYWAIELLKRW